MKMHKKTAELSMELLPAPAQVGLSELDAMTAIAKQLPDAGITFREFVTRACRLRGDSDETIEDVLRRAEEDGIGADSIVQPGESRTKMN